VGYENKTNERGERLIWLERAVVDGLRAMRGPGESYSDVILRLVAAEKPQPKRLRL
jgi:predicted CopG family antitoxin